MSLPNKNSAKLSDTIVAPGVKFSFTTQCQNKVIADEELFDKHLSQFDHFSGLPNRSAVA